MIVAQQWREARDLHPLSVERHTDQPDAIRLAGIENTEIGRAFGNDVVAGTRQGTHAFVIMYTMGKWYATEAWKNADVAMYTSSPVYGDGLIYGLSEKKKGQFVALDAKTGALRWATEGREGDHASLLLTPRHLVYLTNGGNLIVAQRGAAAFTIEKRYQVADTETWAMPVLLGSEDRKSVV